MVSHDCVAFYLLSEEVAQHRKVVQSGQGADEVFGGYYWYPPLAEDGADAATYRGAFVDRAHAEMAEVLVDPHAEDVSRAFVEDALRRRRRRGRRRPAPRHRGDARRRPGQARRQHDDGPRARGAHAVPRPRAGRARGAAARRSSSSPHGGKGILKEAARGIVPDAVIDRPKGYFPVPALSHLEGGVLRARARGAGGRRRSCGPEYRGAAARRPQRRAHDARRLQALAARAARAMAVRQLRVRAAVDEVDEQAERPSRRRTAATCRAVELASSGRRTAPAPMSGTTGTNGTLNLRSRSGLVRRRMMTPMLTSEEREQRADVDELGQLGERDEGGQRGDQRRRRSRSPGRACPRVSDTRPKTDGQQAVAAHRHRDARLPVEDRQHDAGDGDERAEGDEVGGPADAGAVAQRGGQRRVGAGRACRRRSAPTATIATMM